MNYYGYYELKVERQGIKELLENMWLKSDRSRKN